MVNDKALETVLYLAGILVGVAILAIQIYFWLKTGEWSSFSILDVFLYFGFIEERWYFTPDNWNGLHSVMDWLHGSIAIVFAWSLLIFGLSGLGD